MQSDLRGFRIEKKITNSYPRFYHVTISLVLTGVDVRAFDRMCTAPCCFQNLCEREPAKSRLTSLLFNNNDMFILTLSQTGPSLYVSAVNLI